jgi:hypothetical protein
MQDKADTRTLAASGSLEDLPYRIELWRADANELERVLARAASMQLARAIFKAAQASIRSGASRCARAPASSPIPLSD